MPKGLHSLRCHFQNFSDFPQSSLLRSGSSASVLRHPRSSIETRRKKCVRPGEYEQQIHWEMENAAPKSTIVVDHQLIDIILFLIWYLIFKFLNISKIERLLGNPPPTWGAAEQECSEPIILMKFGRCQARVNCQTNQGNRFTVQFWKIEL